MNTFTIRKLFLSTAIASLIAAPVLSQTAVDGSFDHAAQAQSQASALDRQATTQSSSNANGRFSAQVDDRAMQSRTQSAAARTYSSSEGAVRGTASGASQAKSSAQGRLADSGQGETRVGASGTSRSEADAMTALETGDGLQIGVSSASQSTVTAATSIHAQGMDATKGLVRASTGVATKASGSLRAAADRSAESGGSFMQDMGNNISADASFAADVSADLVSTVGSADVLTEAVMDISVGLEHAIGDLGAEVQDASQLELIDGDIHDSLAGDISGELEGTGSLTGGLGI